MAEKNMRKDKKRKTNKGNVRSYKLMTFSEDEESIASRIDSKRENDSIYHDIHETDTKSNHREFVEEQVKGDDILEEIFDGNVHGDQVSVSENGGNDISEHSDYQDGGRKSKHKSKRRSHTPRSVGSSTERSLDTDRTIDNDDISQSSCSMTSMHKSPRKEPKVVKRTKSEKNCSVENIDQLTDRTETSESVEPRRSKRKSAHVKSMFDVSLDTTMEMIEEETSADNCNESKDETVSDKLHDGPVPLEKQVKFCQDRTTLVEKNYGAFCETLSSMTRKIARMRDKGDLLSKQVIEFTNQEKISLSTKKNLSDFAHNLAAVQDYRDAEIHRLENKVIKPLTAYGPKCKKMKQVIKSEQSAINREIKQRKNLEKVRDKKPGDAHSISAAETELQKAAADAAIGSQGLQNQMKIFEKEKITDLKRILADFVSIEMVFHAKAIEYYSQCFENLAMIDEEFDLDEFSRKLNLQQVSSPASTLQLPPGMEVPPGTITSLGSTVRSSNMEGTSEYTSGEYTTGSSYTYTYGESTGSSAEKRVRIQTQSMYDNDDDDDDDDDDDSDDEDDEDDPQMYSKPIRRQ